MWSDSLRRQTFPDAASFRERERCGGARSTACVAAFSQLIALAPGVVGRGVLYGRRVVDASDAAHVWSGTARVVRGGELIAQRSAGFVAGPNSQPCFPGLRFQAGSISKLVLSIVVTELAERHELRLQEAIGDWLDSAPTQWQTITLHQLLSHTSGLGHWGDIPGLPPILATPPPRAELVALIAAAGLVNRPGAGWRYSGPGFLVAALVVEAVTRRAYGDVAAELVLRPAGMRETTSGAFPIGRPGVALGHRHGQPLPVHPAFTDIPGTGDLWTTTEDLIRLNQALRTGRLITPAAAARLWTPHAVISGLSSDGGREAISMAAYGYGTFLGTVNGHEARINPGDNPGYQSLLAYLPGSDVDVAVLCNEDPPSVTAALDELPLR